MKRVRLVLIILTFMCVVAGFVIGLHEALDYYSNIVDRLEYSLGSVIGTTIYAAMAWAVYGIVEGVLYLIRRGRRAR